MAYCWVAGAQGVGRSLRENPPYLLGEFCAYGKSASHVAWKRREFLESDCERYAIKAPHRQRRRHWNSTLSPPSGSKPKAKAARAASAFCAAGRYPEPTPARQRNESEQRCESSEHHNRVTARGTRDPATYHCRRCNCRCGKHACDYLLTWQHSTRARACALGWTTDGVSGNWKVDFTVQGWNGGMGESYVRSSRSEYKSRRTNRSWD